MDGGNLVVGSMRSEMLRIGILVAIILKIWILRDFGGVGRDECDESAE